MCASFQKNIGDILIIKLSYVLDYLLENKICIHHLSLVGGVASNKYLYNRLLNYCKENNLSIFLPLSEMMTDNAAMIAWACINKYDKNINDINFQPNPRLKVEQV